jgi:hypothetical protein
MRTSPLYSSVAVWDSRGARSRSNTLIKPCRSKRQTKQRQQVVTTGDKPPASSSSRRLINLGSISHDYYWDWVTKLENIPTLCLSRVIVTRPEVKTQRGAQSLSQMAGRTVKDSWLLRFCVHRVTKIEILAP